MVLLAAAGVVGANLYIQSPGTQARIQRELSKAIQIPLQLTSTTVTPWGSVHVSGVGVPSAGESQLEAKGFDASFRTFPLLHGRFIVRKITLDTPRIFWVQDADGRWKLPAMPESSEAKAAQTPHAPKQKGPKLSVEKITVKNGSIELIDNAKHRVLLANEVSVVYRPEADGSGAGVIDASRISWSDTVAFTGVHSLVSFKDGELVFTELHASLAGGDVRGSITTRTSGKDNPYSAKLEFANADLARISEEANWQPGQSSGIVSGNFEVHGKTGKPKALVGAGHLSIVNGHFKQLALLETIGTILQIPQLSDLRLTAGAANFRIADEKTYIDSLGLETSDVRISAKGSSQWDGKLNLEAQLSATDRLMHRLPTMIAKNFSSPDKEGRRAIAFSIGGKLDKPRTNLVDKVIGREVSNQFQDLVTSIFGNMGRKKKDKKRDDPRPAAATPAPAVPTAPGPDKEKEK